MDLTLNSPLEKTLTKFAGSLALKRGLAQRGAMNRRMKYGPPNKTKISLI
jgi:hypothetical protein